MICTHRNWYGKKIGWIMDKIFYTGNKTTYSDSSGRSYIKSEFIYQCPKCKRIASDY